LIVQDRFTFCVCTYNSAKTLERCLESIRSIAPKSRLLIIDHYSEDGTVEIARKFGSEIHSETKGLGYARQLCFDLTKTDYIVFVDGDVEIVNADFFEIANHVLQKTEYGAVVGMAVGHRFQFGLPASLLVLRKGEFQGTVIPDYIDARETYFIQRRLSRHGLRTYYVHDAILHRSQFRQFKPEWEGANTRMLPDSELKELLFSLKVILLMSLNSRNVKNILYVPIFYLKFLYGFVKPSEPWLRMKRDARGKSSGN
jgi:glycosyltransferase involved in cell wall biosynthesis